MENKELTEEHINKAFEILGVVSNLEKGDKSEKMEMDSNEEEEEVYKGYKKSKIEKACTMYKGMGSGEMKKAMLEDGFESKFVDITCDYANKEANGGNTEIKKGDIEDLIQKSFGNIENLVKGSSEQVSAKFSAMADIFRAQEARLESLAKSLEVSNNLTGELQDRLNKVESQPNLRKSVTSQRFVERFAKSEDGKDLYSLSDSRSRQDLVSTLNDLSGIRKGENFDKELVEIAQEIELTKSISARGVQKLNSLNIEVHK
jgi:hypothetical protein